MSSDLKLKQCIPCQGGVPPLPQEEKEALRELSRTSEEASKPTFGDLLKCKFTGNKDN